MIKKEHCCFFFIFPSVIAGQPSLWLCEKAWTPLLLLTFSITICDSEDPLSVSKLKSLLGKPSHTTNHLWHSPLCCILLVVGGLGFCALSKALMCMLWCSQLFYAPKPTLSLDHSPFLSLQHQSAHLTDCCSSLNCCFQRTSHSDIMWEHS